jgi:hypothetical protein
MAGHGEVESAPHGGRIEGEAGERERRAAHDALNLHRNTLRDLLHGLGRGLAPARGPIAVLVAAAGTWRVTVRSNRRPTGPADPL